MYAFLHNSKVKLFIFLETRIKSAKTNNVALNLYKDDRSQLTDVPKLDDTLIFFKYE